MPEAAYRASMSVCGRGPGPATGVSGGGGEPLVALVVDVEAVELMRLMEDGSLILSLFNASAVDEAEGGGQ